MESEYIDIHNRVRGYEVALTKFRMNPRVSDRNKEIMIRFLRDAALGKTVIGKAKKRIGPSRLANYIAHLSKLMLFARSDLDQITNDEMEEFVEALETDRIHSNHLGKPRLSPRYKVDIKISIKKFYKWLWGNNRNYPPLVEWIETCCPRSEIRSLTEAEFERVRDSAPSPLYRALIQVLYDGGFRIGEILNIRLRHVSVSELESQGSGARCFVLRAPFSKTMPRTVPLPMPMTTQLLNVWLANHPNRPRLGSDGHLLGEDLGARLFPISYNAVRLTIARLGREVLGKRLHPHVFRHTSATFWAHKLSTFQSDKRFGWVMGSKMPQIYIDREGIDDFAAVQVYHKDEIERLLKDRERLLLELAELRHSTGEQPQQDQI